MYFWSLNLFSIEILNVCWLNFLYMYRQVSSYNPFSVWVRYPKLMLPNTNWCFLTQIYIHFRIQLYIDGVRLEVEKPLVAAMSTRFWQLWRVIAHDPNNIKRDRIIDRRRWTSTRDKRFWASRQPTNAWWSLCVELARVFVITRELGYIVKWVSQARRQCYSKTSGTKANATVNIPIEPWLK